MKIRKFYPSQVLRNLSGKKASGLAAAEKVAFEIGVRRARKAGLVVTVVNDEIDVCSAKQMGQAIAADLKGLAQNLYAPGAELPAPGGVLVTYEDGPYYFKPRAS